MRTLLKVFAALAVVLVLGLTAIRAFFGDGMRMEDRSTEPVLSGDVDFPRFVNALRGVGYRDYLTAELPPYPQFPEQLVRDTVAHLECIINS